MSEPRVAITGVGVVTPAGVGIDDTWNTLLTGESQIAPFDLFDPGHFPAKIAGQLHDFKARKFVPKSYRKAVKVMARDIEIAVAAADLAFRDSGIATRGTADEMDIDPNRLGCNIGAGLICTELDELGQAVNTALGDDGKFDIKRWGEVGMTNLTPLWLLKYLPNMLSCHVTIIHGTQGPSNCITCGDAAGHLSVGESALYIRRGAADAVIAGAAESKLNPMGMLRQGLLKRLNTESNDNGSAAVRPFDVAHNGTAIGEGGGLLILENLERAQSRGAKIYCEVVGFGAACDPKGIDVLRPTAGNLGLALTNAIKTAGLTPDDIDAIFTYGTGVPGEDLAEAKAWQQALGEKAATVPAVSVTGAIGSLFAGAGGAQLGIAAKAISEQTLPPTVNFTAPAEGCALNLLAEPRKLKIKNILVGAHCVGGQSGACVLQAVEVDA